MGVHIAVTRKQSNAVWEAYEAGNDAGVLEATLALEEKTPKSHKQETDVAWDAIHRCLSDGTLDPRAGTWPLKGAVLGGEHLYFGGDHIVVLINAPEVKEIAAALKDVKQDWFEKRFKTLKKHGYRDNDFDYTWRWFEKMRRFFLKTASTRRDVIFTAEQ